jgi:hypothetical protein
MPEANIMHINGLSRRVKRIHERDIRDIAHLIAAMRSSLKQGIVIYYSIPTNPTIISINDAKYLHINGICVKKEVMFIALKLQW